MKTTWKLPIGEVIRIFAYGPGDMDLIPGWAFGSPLTAVG